VGATRGILFGSRARGDYIDSSDVDLVYLEGLPYTEEEFERLKQTSSVVQDALTYGIEIRPEP
jgi:predicted nucleotidyltransferase